MNSFQGKWQQITINIWCCQRRKSEGGCISQNLWCFKRRIASERLACSWIFNWWIGWGSIGALCWRWNLRTEIDGYNICSCGIAETVPWGCSGVWVVLKRQKVPISVGAVWRHEEWLTGSPSKEQNNKTKQKFHSQPHASNKWIQGSLLPWSFPSKKVLVKANDNSPEFLQVVTAQFRILGIPHENRITVVFVRKLLAVKPASYFLGSIWNIELISPECV